MRDEAAFKARAAAALAVREKLLEVVKKLRVEVEATIARHPKGLDASGGGSKSRQKNHCATLTEIVLENLEKVDVLLSCQEALQGTFGVTVGLILARVSVEVRMVKLKLGTSLGTALDLVVKLKVELRIQRSGVHSRTQWSILSRAEFMQQ